MFLADGERGNFKSPVSAFGLAPALSCQSPAEIKNIWSINAMPPICLHSGA
jgi:hypothetical protein